MKSFNEIYEQVYKESYGELETLRKERAKKVSIFILIVAVVVLTTSILINTLFPFIFVAGLIILVIGIANNSTKYTTSFKENIIQPFVKNADENLSYFPKQGIPSALYRRGGFEQHYDNYYTEDLIKGVLDNKYEVKMAEVRTEEETTDSDGDRHTYTLFHGIFGNVECSKDITTTLKVHSDKGFLGSIFKGKTKVDMDSEEFEKYFDVYGDNKIIAMQILTSDVMAMMIDFRTQHKIKYELTIKDKQIFIRFHTGEVFEPKLFKDSLDYNMLKRYYDIIDFIFKVSREINKAIDATEI